MKMLFIYPDVGGNSIDFSPAIEILSPCLKNSGVDVELIHLHDQYSFPIDMEKICDKVKEIAPDVIGITATTFQYKLSNNISKCIKESGFKNLILLGGIHATISPQDLADSYFDGFTIGEGEITLPELFRRLESGEDICSIKGLNIKRDGKIYENSFPDVISNLDELPPRDYEIINIEKLLKLRNNWFSIAFSRGCPYSCNFCINQKLRRVFQSSCRTKYYRCQSVEKAMYDLMLVIEKYHSLIKVVNLDDDLLILDEKWFIEFATQFKERIYEPYGIKYAINGRANLINENIVKMLSISGCDLVRVGFETGDEKMRNVVLSKEITDEQLKNSFYLFNRYKVRSLAFSMIGIPGESIESIEASIKMLRRLKPTLIRMSIFEPFIGTPIYDYCVENNLFLNNDENDNCFVKSSIKFDGLSAKELVIYHIMFPWFLNLEFVSEEYQVSYKALIDRYSSKSLDELCSTKMKKEVLQADSEIASELAVGKIDHFKYYNTNTFYYCLEKFN